MKGTDIFEAVNKLVSDYWEHAKCSCILTDEARAMIGTEIVFSWLLELNNSNCPVILFRYTKRSYEENSYVSLMSWKWLLKQLTLLQGIIVLWLMESFVIFLPK